MLEPKRIIKNGIATIVFWNDDTKTIVKCAEDDEPDDYMAFCAAYCKKVFGSNSHLKRVIKNARNAKFEKVAKTKDWRENLTCAYISPGRGGGKLKLIGELKEIPTISDSSEIMPGCLECKSVGICPDSRYEHASDCRAYNHWKEFMF